MSALHELVVPRLHFRLAECRDELERVYELATELAEALDDEVDARWERRELDAHKTARALRKAREAGLL